LVITHATGRDLLNARRDLQRLLQEAGGVAGSPEYEGAAHPHIPTPFGTAEAVEGDVVSAIDVGVPEPLREDVGFVDGIQRFSVVSWVGVVPVVRAAVGAAALRREDGRLTPVIAPPIEEFVVVPSDGLDEGLVAEIRTLPFVVKECQPAERPHPILDYQRAVGVVEGQRVRAERSVCREFRSVAPDAWLVVDGGIRGLDALSNAERLVGVIKSHETQFLAGRDFETALRLDEGQRTSVFRRFDARSDPVYSWYLRLWDWRKHDLLYGLLRLERVPDSCVLEDVGVMSRWLLAERAPLAARDRRWDRLLYPMHEVEQFLKARAGGWQ
jgi:hypothetical protein